LCVASASAPKKRGSPRSWYEPRSALMSPSVPGLMVDGDGRRTAGSAGYLALERSSLHRFLPFTAIREVVT